MSNQDIGMVDISSNNSEADESSETDAEEAKLVGKAMTQRRGGILIVHEIAAFKPNYRNHYR